MALHVLESSLLVESDNLDPMVLPFLLLLNAKSVLVLQVLLFIGICTQHTILLVVFLIRGRPLFLFLRLELIEHLYLARLNLSASFRFIVTLVH